MINKQKLVNCIKHYQKFAKYQRIYRRNISVGILRSKLPTETFPSVVTDWITDGKVSEFKKKAGRWRGGFGGFFFTDGFKTTARTVPVQWCDRFRRLNCRRTHRGIWNGRSVRWRVYISVRITDVITDGVSVGETVGKS
jgi:hypothetical protein